MFVVVVWSRARAGVDGGVFGCCGRPVVMVAGARVRVEANRAACCGAVRSGG
jgi:hypothetical protein